MKTMEKKKKDVGKESLALHKKLKGKVSITPKVIVKNKEMLSLVYTPGVGAVSLHVAKNKKDLPLYTMQGNTVAVISDGSAVLGLGNIGPEGALPVMEGKSLLFKSLANIDAFPIVLSTQDTEQIIQTVKNIAPVFGGINLEDIAAPRCFEIEKRLQRELSIPVLHDDQHGTALVALAGLINAFKVTKKNPKKSRVVIAGAGAAGSAIAELLMLFGIGDIILLDSQGILSRNRKDLEPHKRELAKKTNKENRQGGITEALERADVFIGVSKANTVTEEHVRSMAKNSIVFALANPVPEIMPDAARRGGAMVIATGRSDFANQINNSLGFPGIFRGALDHRVRKITDDMLIRAAKNLAAVVKVPRPDKIVPHTFDRGVVEAVARAIR